MEANVFVSAVNEMSLNWLSAGRVTSHLTSLLPLRTRNRRSCRGGRSGARTHLKTL